MCSARSAESDRAFLLAVWYRGPWDRLSALFLGVRGNGTLRWEIPLGATGWRKALGDLADYCDRREIAWRARHAREETTPHRIWKRKSDRM